jgi:hypothetical protein
MKCKPDSASSLDGFAGVNSDPRGLVQDQVGISITCRKVL